MRVWLAAAGILVPLLAGCLTGGPSQPPVVTVPDLVMHRADGEDAVGIPVPAASAGTVSFADIHTGFPGAEPNIGVTPEGTLVATAYETILRSQDDGRSWDDVYTQRIGFTNDPMLWVDSETGRIFSPQQFPEGSCSSQVFSDDEGDTWLEKPLTCGVPLVDHQKIASGPLAGPLATAAPLAVYPRLVSYCYNKPDVGTHCAVSLDGGVTFSIDQLVDPVPGSSLPAASGTPPSCGGLNGHQNHGPDGEILLPYGYECRRARLARSTDGGLSWERLDLGERNLELDPEVAATRDGTWYYLYRGADERPYLLRSSDLFDTIEGPFAVAPPHIKGTMFLGLAAGDEGRIAVTYLGNTASDAGPDSVPRTTEWHLFVGFSDDADSDEPTFLTARVTPESDPVQRGTICMDKPCRNDPGGGTSNRNLLDFLDMAISRDGRVYVSYADGCTTGSCHADGASPRTSRDDELAIAWLLSGPSLTKATPLRAPPA